VIPVAFTPYGQGPLRAVGWQAELAWLPLSAALSSAALYRAHARRRRQFLGPPPAKRVRTREEVLRRYRTRIGVAVGTIALVLICLPFVPAVAGVGGSTVRYSYQHFTKEITGQFLETGHGSVALFAWDDPQQSYPHDALRIHASNVHSFVIRAAAVDSPAGYQLYDLDRGGSVPLAVRRRAQTRLVLSPARRLRPGRYELVAAKEGMFGGRDYDYLSVVAPGAPETAIGSATSAASTPAVADALLPLGAAAVALLFAILLGASFLRRPGGQKALWGAGFACFGVAAACEAAAQRAGWSESLFKAYYISGGVLTVALLGAGSAWLLLRPRGRDLLLGGVLVAAIAAIVAVALAPVDHAALAAAPGLRPPANSDLRGHAFLWAVALNSFGTACLVGGALLGILRRRRVRTNLWIGGGALVVALATGLSRAHTYSFVYAGELVGICMMFYGFRFAAAAPASARQEPRPEVAGAQPASTS
jgi:hypothetical protein